MADIYRKPLNKLKDPIQRLLRELYDHHLGGGATTQWWKVHWRSAFHARLPYGTSNNYTNVALANWAASGVNPEGCLNAWFDLEERYRQYGHNLAEWMSEVYGWKTSLARALTLSLLPEDAWKAHPAYRLLRIDLALWKLCSTFTVLNLGRKVAFSGPGLRTAGLRSHALHWDGVENSAVFKPLHTTAHWRRKNPELFALFEKAHPVVLACVPATVQEAQEILKDVKPARGMAFHIYRQDDKVFTHFTGTRAGSNTGATWSCEALPGAKAVRGYFWYRLGQPIKRVRTGLLRKAGAITGVLRDGKLVLESAKAGIREISLPTWLPSADLSLTLS